MWRTRMLWFAVGFSAGGVAFSNTVLRRRWVDDEVLLADVKQKFGGLENRVSSIESGLENRVSNIESGLQNRVSNIESGLEKVLQKNSSSLEGEGGLN